MIWFLFLSCQPAANDSAEIPQDCADPSYEEWTEGFLRGKCQPCHAIASPNRYGAPPNVYFDTKEASLFWAESIRRTTLDEESMPPSGGVTEDEKELLRRWLDCN